MKVWSSLSWEAEGSRKLAQVSLDRVFEPCKDHPSTEFLSSSGPEYYIMGRRRASLGQRSGWWLFFSDCSLLSPLNAQASRRREHRGSWGAEAADRAAAEGAAAGLGGKQLGAPAPVFQVCAWGGGAEGSCRLSGCWSDSRQMASAWESLSWNRIGAPRRSLAPPLAQQYRLRVSQSTPVAEGHCQSCSSHLPSCYICNWGWLPAWLDFTWQAVDDRPTVEFKVPMPRIAVPMPLCIWLIF